MSTCNSGNNVITIIQGEDRTLSLRIINSDGSPYNLNSPDEIILKLPKEDRTALEKKLSLQEVIIISDSRGELSINLSDEDTASLQVKELQDFEVIIEKNEITRNARFENVLTVKKTLL